MNTYSMRTTHGLYWELVLDEETQEYSVDIVNEQHGEPVLAHDFIALLDGCKALHNITVGMQ